MNESLQASPKKNKERTWIILAAAAFLAALVAWLWFTPGGFWGKLRALGYSVCHQIEERSICVHGVCAPLCARCTGMYLGTILALGYQAFQRRKGKFPPVWVWVVLALLFVWFGVDGLNSFLHLIPFLRGVYEPNNLLRLITGFGVGLGIGTVLFALFNRTAWIDWINESPYKRWFSFPLLLVLAGIAIALIRTEHPLIIYPMMVLSGLSVFAVLSGVYTVLAIIVLRRENAAAQWRELLLPILLGMTTALLQILVISWLRYALTGTWNPIHL